MTSPMAAAAETEARAAPLVEQRERSKTGSFDIEEPPSADEASDEAVSDQTAAEQVRTGTFLSSWSVMANTILGVGMLALPWAAAKVGWVLAFVLLFGAGSFAQLSLHLLACIAVEQGGKDTTFYGVCTQVAPSLRLFVDIAIAAKCFGVASSYLQVIAQTVVKVFRPAQKDQQLVRFLAIMVCVMAIVPIVYRRRIGKTSWSNWLSLGSIMYVCVVGIVYCAGNLFFGLDIQSQEGESIEERTSMWPESGISVLTTVPVFIFSFTCHQNLFPVANELQDATVRRITLVTSSAVNTAIVMYLVLMVLGYSAFGRSIPSNFLLALPRGAFVDLGSLLLALSNALSYPLQNYPCRKSLMVLASSVAGKTFEYPDPSERWLRRALTTFILVGTVTVATLVDDLGIVFEIVGTVGSNTICYIMPAFLYIQTFRGKPHSATWKMSLAILQLCIGLCVLPTCLVAIFLEASQ